MHMNFEAVGWCYVVALEEGEEINYGHDLLALVTILRSVLSEMLSFESSWEEDITSKGHGRRSSGFVSASSTCAKPPHINLGVSSAPCPLKYIVL
jgi:hypothetical protein